VASFRSTLAEIQEADLVLHAVDASSPGADEERRVALEVLAELGVSAEAILTAWTKRDLLEGKGAPSASATLGWVGQGLPVSAVSGAGLEELESEIRRRRGGGGRGGQFYRKLPLAQARRTSREK
jgi:GTP-binding protein HflX